MKQNGKIFILNFILLSCILGAGCSTLQTKMVNINKNSFEVQSDHKYAISNIHVINDSGELFLKGSVSKRFGKSPLLSGHIDIIFLNISG